MSFVMARSSSIPAVSSSSLKNSSSAHLQVRRYGEFELTDAIRPSFDLKIVPMEGYRHDVYQDEESRNRVPVVMASASNEHLFDIFMDMLDPLGSVVDVVLETSHEQQKCGHLDLYREHIDMPVLKSILWDFEEMLLNDGCTGIAVLNPSIPQEVQFDEHKLLIAYGSDLASYEEILRDRACLCAKTSNSSPRQSTSTRQAKPTPTSSKSSRLASAWTAISK